MLAQTIFAAVLAATAGLAAPVEARQENYFTPSAIWKYNTRNGAIYSTEQGYVSKATNNGGNDITALLTFTYPQAAKDKKCQFAFYLDSKDSISGSKKLDLYTSNSPAPGPRDTWGPGNQRNIHLGRLDLKLGGFATWDSTQGAYMTQKTNCKAPDTVEGFELVGVFDDDAVYWNPSVAGPRIVYS